MGEENSDIARFPDLFADAISISSQPFGVSLTFGLSDPSGGATGRTVARIRMTPELAKALGEALATSVSRSPAGEEPA